MKKLKTEHAGAKNGGGYWGKRDAAKRLSKRARREDDKRAAANEADRVEAKQSSPPQLS